MSLTSKSNRNAKKYRIVFLGDQGVGKTSIIERYTTDRFDEGYNVLLHHYIYTVHRRNRFQCQRYNEKWQSLSTADVGYSRTITVPQSDPHLFKKCTLCCICVRYYKGKDVREFELMA